VVESVVAMFQPRCGTRSAEIRVVQNERLQLPVPADDLRQILTNLVSNACDALPPAGGLVEVEVAREANVAAISIRDNGSGISPENAVRVFDPFFTTKEDTGTGIGLWVTRDLVDKNGGRILLTDELPPGFRTQFRVEFAMS
jgi:signal transduction histidine kinase